MPVVNMPDGTPVSFPDNMPPDQIRNLIQQKFPNAAQLAAQPAQSSGQREFAAGQAAGTSIGNTPLIGPALTAADQAARQYLPLGLGKDVGAAARYVGQAVAGHPESFSDALAYSGGQSAGEQAASPVAGTVGGVAGGVGQIAALSPLAKAALPLKGALALKTGQAVKNAGRLAAAGAITGGELGAATGAVQGGINEGNPSATGALAGAATGGLTGAAEGAVAGPLAGGLAAGAKGLKTAVLSSDAQRAEAALAKVFNVSPNDLNSARAQFKLDTGGIIDPRTGLVTGGRDPAMGELTDLYNRGEIQRMAGKSPVLGARVAQAADASAAALPARLQGQVQSALGQPEDIAELVNGRKANFDAGMEPIRDQKINLWPEEVDEIRRDVLPVSGLTRQARKAIHTDLDAGQISLGDADTIRQNMNAKNVANPGDVYGDHADLMGTVARQGSQEYNNLMNQYAEESRYINGFQHGLTGKTRGQTTDQGLITDLATNRGEAGYRSGLATRYSGQAFKGMTGATNLAGTLEGENAEVENLRNTFSPARVGRLQAAAGAEKGATESLNAIAPTMPPPRQQTSLGELGIGAVTQSPKTTAIQLIKKMAPKGMSDNVANIVADYLTRPNMLPAGVNILRKAGLSDAQLRQVVQSAGRTGAIASSTINQQAQ